MSVKEFKTISAPESNSQNSMDISEASSKKFPNMLKVGSVLRTWTEVSRINYTSMKPLDLIKSGQSLRRKVIGLKSTDYSLQCFVPSELRNRSEEELFDEQFPVNVTSLMNEDQYWGSFYVFPELYADAYSPVVRVKRVEQVPNLVDGVLTRDLVSACLSYLKRIPILGDYVFVKLDLSIKDLINIQVLQHYKFIVYLDLSTNSLTDLSVLSHLLYLQYLSVSFNKLTSVLEYDTPQWLLTEVHYKYNLVSNIRDISCFWSIAILDLSHNNIKSISGLENLMHLRRLDLSYNHITRLENFNNLRLLWLDVSNNQVSTYEFGEETGLRTLLHLEYLNLSDNNLSCMKMFAGCTRLRELHAQNNCFPSLLELNLYMRQLRRLIILDLRSNPVCDVPGYKSVVMNTFPVLLCLDSVELDPIEQRSLKLEFNPDVTTSATRRLLRLLFVEQLRRSTGRAPPVDAATPLLVFVGQEAVGKGRLARRLAAEWPERVAAAKLHTTATHHFAGHYIPVTRRKFDEMLLDGDFLTYTELKGESYGLSRKEARLREGQVCVACMDLLGALMLRLRGRRPYLILATCLDKCSLAERQMDRKTARISVADTRMSRDTAYERSALQALLSGRIMVTGIINEIILALPDEKSRSEFQIESGCSLLREDTSRDHPLDFAKDVNFLTISTSSASLFDVGRRMLKKTSDNDTSFCSLYKESACTEEYQCELAHCARERRRLDSYREGSEPKGFGNEPKKRGILSQKMRESKSVDFSKPSSSTSKALPETKSKSVSIIPQGTDPGERIAADYTEPLLEEDEKAEKSSDTTLIESVKESDDLDLWLAFLADNSLLSPDDDVCFDNEEIRHHKNKNNHSCMKGHLNFLMKDPYESTSSTTRDVYEAIHRNRPGLFWDTITMDDPEKAFNKAKTAIRDVARSQQRLSPMFELDFTNGHYPSARARLASIRAEIAPKQLFY